MRPERSGDGASPTYIRDVHVSQVMTGDDIARTLRRISHEIIESHDLLDTVVLVGIHTRGVLLAREISRNIGKITGIEAAVGELDVGPYRDDRDSREKTATKPTDVPDINGKQLVVIDDVLFTGRTIRAALDALADIGRAGSTSLAVLVDRGHRELPIKADHVGKNLPTSKNETVTVRLAEIDDVDGVWVETVVAA